MRRSVWIFFASILLPSLGLAWLAVHSVRDQQVVLEHQEAIISQNITDALAKQIQSQMDQVRGDFVKTTQQLASEDPGASPQTLAQNFNRKLHRVWPLAEIGFAVNLNGDIYSPRITDGLDAKTFRDENDRFLSNRENVQVYSSNSMNAGQSNANSFNAPNDQSRSLHRASAALDEIVEKKALSKTDTDANIVSKIVTASVATKEVPPAPSFHETDKAKSIDSLTDDSTADFKKTPLPVPAATASAAKQSPDTYLAPAASAAQPSREAKTDESAMPDASTAEALPAAAPSPTFAPAVAGGAPALSTPAPAAETASTPGMASSLKDGSTSDSSSLSFNTANTATQQVMKIARNVIPQQALAQVEVAPLSNTVPEESDFRRVIGEESSGSLARFLENKLRLIVWSHTSADSPIIFGAQLDQTRLIEELKNAFQIPELQQASSFSRSGDNNYCVAILDDSGHPVAVSRSGFKADWKHPFVATEIGESLPHWEAALYLVDPEKISRSARTLQFTLGLIVLLLVAAIVSGGSLIAADVRRQVRLAQQKTDFVSNVSHELKTPLTSIRMFADLLAEKRVPDEERQATYLRIIAAEAARLTRLINNVLDFARLERNAPPGEHRSCDLVEAVRDVIETCAPHLEASGISFHHEIEAESLPISGDRDALAQIILNLVSNAEKYGGQDIIVRVRRQETSSGALGCVDILDRGPGIPPKEVKLIFEAFHRLDDSLSSGIPGSGLGLTLARRMARAHSGDVTCSPRAGGGSCFTLSIPLTPSR